MSNERNDSDRLVSDVYHELADEKTPETLNREVLRRAAKEGRTRYSIARAWMRPAAWAATIGLSLVVVLELANMPESEMSPLPQSVPPGAAAAPEDSDRRRDSIDEDTMLESKATEERQDGLAKRSRPYSPEEQVAEKAMMLNEVAPASSDARDDEIASPGRDLPQALEAADLDSMKESFERTRKQVEQPIAVERKVEQAADRAPLAQSSAAGIASMRMEAEYLCPAELRLSAEKWLQCIMDLEETTARELVDREYEAFRKSFPKFEHPAVDR